MTNKRVVTIQDISCLGQCSLTVALPIISSCGIETIIIPSAVLSTHTGGFEGYTFRNLTDDIPGIIKHWKEANQTFDCLYTGYLGSILQIDYVYDLIGAVLNDNAPVIVDPAMADNGKLYYGFDEKFVDKMAELCSKSDIILPNITEAALMTGTEIRLEGYDESYIKSLIQRLLALGAKDIVLKGISYEENTIGVAVYEKEEDELRYYFTERIDGSFHGTGDCYAAAFTGAFMQGRTKYESAKIATDFVVDSIKKTIDDTNHWYGVKFEKALPKLVKMFDEGEY